MLPITLCTFVRNEEGSISDCIQSVRPIVSEIVVVDTGSTDKTVEVARKYTNRVYSVGFSDFGSIRTLTAHLALMPWVLMLDADERILQGDWNKLAQLISQPQPTAESKYETDADGNLVVDSWALPRIRWADRWMSKQVDSEAYPDWQVRLFRNHFWRERISFKRRVHETVSGCVFTRYSEDGPTIHHFQNINKDEAKLKERQELYTRLYEQDLAEGIEHSEPPVIEEDKV